MTSDLTSMRIQALSILVLAFLSACGDEKQEEVVEPAAIDAAEPAPKAAPQIPGFGPVTIRLMGTIPKPGAGTVYAGDCDDMRPHDDDFEVMTFSAPWSIIGRNQGGAGAGLGAPVNRAFVFEKNPDAAEVRLKLDFGRERSNATVAMLTDGLPTVADIAFGDGKVGLFRVPEPDDLIVGYAAIFPTAQLEGAPAEPEFTGRYIATVQLISLSLPEFDGWSEAEIIELYDSFYTARCLGVGLERGLAPFAPKTIYE